LIFFLLCNEELRLFQQVRENAGLAYTVDCDYISFSESGLFAIYLSTTTKNLLQAIKIVAKELERLKNELVSGEDLDRVKSQLKGMLILSSEQMDSRQEAMGRSELLLGKYFSLEETLQKINAVTASSIREWSRRMFQTKKGTLVTLGPKKFSESQLGLF
jgi:predicted Zn-dependent peptidase